MICRYPNDGKKRQGYTDEQLSTGSLTRSHTQEPHTPKGRFSGLWDHTDNKALTTTKEEQYRTPSLSGLASKNAATTSTFAASKLQKDTSSTAKAMSSPFRQSESSAKALSLANHGALHSPTSSSSSRARKSELIATNYKKTLLKSSPSTTSSLPPPAVKSRIYSSPRSSSQRKSANGSKNLESFGFVPATLLPARANTAVSRSAAAAATPTPTSNSTLNPPFQSHYTSKDIKQEDPGHAEPLRAQSIQNQLSAKTSRSTAATVACVPKVEAQSVAKLRHIAAEAIRVQSSNLLQSPQTPENPKNASKHSACLSSSAGSRADPYSISSDSDSDDDDTGDDGTITITRQDRDDGNKNENENNDRNSITKPSPLKSLSSFAEIPSSSHETASDVEAVLNQYSAWFDSPSPTMSRPRRDLGQGSNTATPTASTGTTITTPTTAVAAAGNDSANVRTAPPAWPTKRLWDNSGKKADSTGSREKRRVRFSEDDGDAFSPSPLPPAKRIAIKKESIHPSAGRIDSWSSFSLAPSSSSSFRQPSTTVPVPVPTFGSDPGKKIASSLSSLLGVEGVERRSKNDGPEVIVVDSDSDSDSDLDSEAEPELEPEPHPNSISEARETDRQKRGISLKLEETNTPVKVKREIKEEGEEEEEEEEKMDVKENEIVEKKLKEEEKEETKLAIRKKNQDPESTTNGDRSKKRKKKQRKRNDEGKERRKEKKRRRHANTGKEKTACRHRNRKRNGNKNKNKNGDGDGD